MSVHVSLIVHPNVYACERKKVNAIALALTFFKLHIIDMRNFGFLVCH